MKKFAFRLFFFFISSFGFSQNFDPFVDSLETIVKTSKDPKAIIDAKSGLIRSYYNAGKKDFALDMYRNALSDAVKINYQAGVGALYNSYGSIYYNLSMYDSAMYYFEKSLAIREKVNDKVGVIKALNNIGSIYYAFGDYKKGLEYLEKAAKKETEAGIEEGSHVSINNIGYIYTGLKLYRKSFYYFKKAEKIGIKTKDIQSLVFTYDGMATAYQSLNVTDSALIYALKSMELAKSINDQYSLAYSLNSIGILYNDKKDYSKAIEYFNKAIEQNKAIDDQRLLLSIYGNMATSYMASNKPDEAFKYAEQVIELEKKFNITTDKLAISEMLSVFFARKKDYEKAYRYLKDFNSYQDSLYTTEVTKQLSEMQAKYDVERKEKENTLLQKENDLKNAEIEGHKTTRNYLIGLIGLFILIIAGAIYSYRKIKAFSSLLAVQKNSIEHKNHLLEEQKKEITDSINYAKRIQYSLLAHDDILKENIPEHFVMFKPKDIVSGDFYWATHHGNKFYLAVCDSTGHGVPGAFMSLLNIGFLSEAIKEKNLVKPNEVFNYVRERLIESISRDKQQDGMDGILVCFDQTTSEITYAAAHNAPVLVSNGLLTELEKDKMPVGKGERAEEFKLFTLKASKGDTLYLYTDGYADQFGGPGGKKFKYKSLNDLLLKSSEMPLDSQLNILTTTFDEWKRDLEQIDDVCVIGIRL